MARTFQIKRGAKANMPTLAQGEFGFVTDSGAEELYIGNGSENIQIARQDEMPGLATTTEAGLVTVDGTAGIGVNTENGNLFIKQATESEIDDKQHSYKPITPENLDYAVKAGIVNNANALTDDEKAAALEWLGVSAINPEFNLSSHQIANATYLGENITEGAENDTVEFWADTQSGRAWFSTEGMLIDQPSQYGFLINHTYAADVFQIFRSQSGGPTYWRSGNQEGWDGTWAQVYTSADAPDRIGVEYIGDFDGKTIGELRAALDNWMTDRIPDVGVCQFSANESFFQLWDANDETAVIEGGVRWTCYIVGNSYDTNYVRLMLNSYYADGVYFLTKQDGAWVTSTKAPLLNENGELIIDGNVKGIYTIGEWLQTTADTHRSEAAEKYAVLDGSGWIYHRTPDEVRSDIGAAPAGFGLGEHPYRANGNVAHVTTQEEIDNLTACGWYSCYLPGVTINNLSVWAAVIRVSSYIESRLVQEMYVPDLRVWLTRSNYNGTWSEWDCDNPPMRLGVEYRTTERINSKAVYKRNNNGVIEYRLDGETTWKPYATAVGAAPAQQGITLRDGISRTDTTLISGPQWYRIAEIGYISTAICNIQNTYYYGGSASLSFLVSGDGMSASITILNCHGYNDFMPYEKIRVVSDQTKWYLDVYYGSDRANFPLVQFLYADGKGIGNLKPIDWTPVDETVEGETVKVVQETEIIRGGNFATTDTALMRDGSNAMTGDLLVDKAGAAVRLHDSGQKRMGTFYVQGSGVRVANTNTETKDGVELVIGDDASTAAQALRIIYKNALQNVYHTANKPTAADVGALATNGGTMKGNVKFGAEKSLISWSDTANVFYLYQCADSNDLANSVSLRLSSNDLANALVLRKTVDDVGTNYPVLHSGNVGDYAAPAGFGLGEDYNPRLNSSELAAQNRSGWNFFYDTENPVDDITYGAVVTKGQNPWVGGFYSQEMDTRVGNAFERLIRYNNSGLTAWAYDIPAMLAGKEYRTTDSIDGKSVFKRYNNGIIEYRLDGETTWKPYATAVGGVNKAGDTMTGKLQIMNAGASVVLYRPDWESYPYGAKIEMGYQRAYLTVLDNIDNPNTYRSLVVKSRQASGVKDAAVLIHCETGTISEYNILHTGNVVASATDITAGSSASWQQYHVYE